VLGAFAKYYWTATSEASLLYPVALGILHACVTTPHPWAHTSFNPDKERACCSRENSASEVGVKIMKTMVISAIPALTVLFSRLTCVGMETFKVTVDTAALVGNSAGPFSLDFQVTDGNANNTVVISDYSFPGGNWIGPSSTMLSINEGDTDTRIDQIPMPVQGSLLEFTVALTTAVGSGGPADVFSFAIVDSAFSKIPTFGPGDELLTVDINSAFPPVTTYSSDSPINIPAPTVLFGAVPDAGVPVFVSGGLLGGLCLLRRRHHHGASHQ
jgi:hypothetical protein